MNIMDPDKAIQVFHSLIEQVNGNGGFKKLAELDHVRTAHATLLTLVKSQTHEKNNQSS